jgi:hypothetical protein
VQGCIPPSLYQCEKQSRPIEKERVKKGRTKKYIKGERNIDKQKRVKDKNKREKDKGVVRKERGRYGGG